MNRKGIIIAGTDTGVGKTTLSALLMAALPQAVYWKPIQSGLLEETDTETVQRLSGCSASRVVPEAYRLTQPLSPHLSARLDETQIEQSNLELPDTSEFLIVETAGGVLVPIQDKLLQIELFSRWGLPVLIASRSTLGTINHTLLTLSALRARELPIAGVVAIGPLNEENEKAIQHYGKTPILGRIPVLEEMNATALIDVYSTQFEPFRNRFSKHHENVVA